MGHLSDELAAVSWVWLHPHFVLHRIPCQRQDAACRFTSHHTRAQAISGDCGLLCSQMMREGIAKHGGYEINTEGDAFQVSYVKRHFQRLEVVYPISRCILSATRRVSFP